MQAGVAHFDTAFGAKGSCPFIKGTTGNFQPFYNLKIYSFPLLLNFC
jgi:hypothetical protein